MKHLFYTPHRALQQFIKGYTFLSSENILNMKALPVSDGLSAEIGILTQTGNAGLKVKYYQEKEECEFKSFMGNVVNQMEYISSDGNQLRYIGVITYPYKKFDDRLNVLFNDPHFFKKNGDTRQIAKALYTTPRSLQRFFKETMGVSPKKLLNIFRANALITDIKLGKFSNSSDIALSYKFWDQSHFNAEFKAATNLTPGFFIKNRDRLFLNYARHLILLDKNSRRSE